MYSPHWRLSRAVKILVVGPGAMGTLFAALLAFGGHQVTLLGRRPEVVETINSEGVTVVRGRTRKTAPVRAISAVGRADVADLVLMCVKAFDTLQATRDAARALGPEAPVMTLQNGLNNLETIASVVGRERVIGGVTSQGATLLAPGLVRHAGEGRTAIGEMDGKESPRLRSMADAFREAGIGVELSRSVDSLVWGKMVINCSINPLSALLRVTNGQLLERQETRALLGAVAQESASVARARGITLSYDDPVGRVETVCRLTAANRSSMLQDIERGVRTEIEYISGAMVREGDATGTPTPLNWTLLQLVRGLESFRAAPAPTWPAPPSGSESGRPSRG